MSIRIQLLAIIALTGLFSFKSAVHTNHQDNLKKFYDEYQVQGTFVLYDQKNDHYTYYNKEQTTIPFTPASTFKICNSLIALETGAVKDENVVFKWDKKERPLPVWNADTDMRNAFKNSTVWFYQELAKRIGEKKMKFWLNKAGYGNENINGGIDGFWLWGGLRITPVQQIDFLKRLQGGELPFSSRSMDIVKSIMIVKNTKDNVIRAKTGNGKQGDLYVSWYIGYITTNDNVYYFSNCIQSEDKKPDFKKAGVAIAINVLDDLKVVKKQDWDN
ncbi:beta-lactamase class D [Pedobacter cryoconitis]|uniref:class D beta-lactamase n=1 Tax=Pedobacter cryoconitis TaxID=188932 RepID=UPI001612DF8A|nr:class D beta-lactamase [Pedobacter cryoconitis]MBB6272032.1 beta-lactamase class D [Pedobacter cryoconitis]